MEADCMKVLVLEDNPDDERLICEMVQECGCDNMKMQFERTLDKGLDRLKRGGFDVVLVDLGLPDSQGLDTLETIRAAHPRLPVVVLTGLIDEATGVEAVRRGAQDYLVKGHVDGHSICSAIRYAVEREALENRLQDSAVQLHRMLDGTVEALIKMTELRDMFNAGQQHRVSKLAVAIAREMGLPEERIECVRVAGLLHDVGKVAIPSEILSRQETRGKLEDGMENQHVEISCEVLRGIDFPWPVQEVVLQHHELMDGSGFPNGLKGEQIMVEARIIAVADEVDELSVTRPMRPRTPGLEKALEAIAAGRGRAYDPQVVDACLKVFKEGKYRYD